jgi:hypothetical protein
MPTATGPRCPPEPERVRMSITGDGRGVGDGLAWAVVAGLGEFAVILLPTSHDEM